ncbi:Rtr1/RPAP2 family-domain-containing protein [Tuber brumale]|nr:Rtr1/RPAP2 family-domain-containing protein [Tuber brumale]
MTTKQPKSILKKTREPSSSSATAVAGSTIVSTGPPTSQSKPLPTPEEARAIALSHAHSIQIRKVIELSILTSLEQLVDFPLPDSTSTDLKCHLRYFQSSDFDSLMEERGICDKCSYPLCPNPRKRLAGGGKSAYALVDKGKKTMRFVEKEKLEQFCSDICARQGLWLRVQLSTEPAWTRAEIISDVQVDEKGTVSGLDLTGEKWRGGLGAEILLLEEAEEQRRQAKWNNTKEADIEKLAEELMEVGINLDKETRGLKQSDSLFVDIKERENEGGTAKPPELILTDENGDRARAIEGYTPKIGPVYTRKISREEGRNVN